MFINIAALGTSSKPNDNGALIFLEKMITVGFDREWSIKLHNNLVDLDDGVYYNIGYFLSTHFAEFAAALTIILPLVGSLFLLCFGYLIGSTYSIYFATFLVFLSFLSSSYLLLLFPVISAAFIKFATSAPQISHGLKYSSQMDSINYEESVVRLDLIGNPLYDPIFLELNEKENLNVEVNFGSFVDTFFL